MNPAIPLPALIAIAGAVLGVAWWGAWRGSAGLPAGVRGVLLGLRLLAVGAVAALLMDPGRWVNPTTVREPGWLVLLDSSASMRQPTADGKSRASTAAELARMARAHAAKAQVPLAVRTFAEALGPEVDEPPAAADGTATRIVAAVSQALQDAAATGAPLAGIVALTDGRQTIGFSQAELDAVALSARSQNARVHAVVIGVEDSPADLALLQPRGAITAFAGQSLRVPFAIRSSGLGPVKPVVVLRDEEGGELATLAPDVPPGQTVAAAFEVAAPAASARWTLETPVLPGEVRAHNNQAALNIRVLTSKTRVFLLEGAPYWDSKFLAQLLRAQSHVELQSVHRLSDQRYFRIDTGSNTETDRPVFPATLAELARFDLVVFGKNADPFLTPENTSMLRAYVRDHGGAVLFSRGKPTTLEQPALEPLEPVVWGSSGTAEFRFAPNRDGEAAGLFGQALPAPDASLWASLPPLRDARQVAMVKPFSRILADGVAERGSSARFPVLVVRRYGQGVTGLFNGDGLWKWDFFPEARELGNCYEDFWTQVIQWMAGYSEFLPGHDYSLRLPALRGEAGVPVAGVISYRGPADDPRPEVEVTAPDGRATRVAPAAVPDPSGRRMWRLSFTPDQSGPWQLRLVDSRPDGPPAPEAVFTVPQPPAEEDDLAADPDLARALARAAGGGYHEPAGFAAFATANIVKAPPAARESGAVWHSAWRLPAVALVLAAVFAIEWFIRRRQGLG